MLTDVIVNNPVKMQHPFNKNLGLWLLPLHIGDQMYDVSAYKTHHTLNTRASGQTWTNGKHWRALDNTYKNGNNITCNGIPSSSSAFSLSMWFKLNSASDSNMEMVTVGSVNSTGARCSPWIGSSQVGAECGSSAFLGSWTPDTKWHNIFLTHTGTLATGTIDLDGRVLTPSLSGSGSIVMSHNNVFTLGKLSAAGGYEFNGQIADIRCWRHQLPYAMRRAIYEDAASGKYECLNRTSRTRRRRGLPFVAKNVTYNRDRVVYLSWSGTVGGADVSTNATGITLTYGGNAASSPLFNYYSYYPTYLDTVVTIDAATIKTHLETIAALTGKITSVKGEMRLEPVDSSLVWVLDIVVSINDTLTTSTDTLGVNYTNTTQTAVSVQTVQAGGDYVGQYEIQTINRHAALATGGSTSTWTATYKAQTTSAITHTDTDIADDLEALSTITDVTAYASVDSGSNPTRSFHVVVFTEDYNNKNAMTTSSGTISTVQDGSWLNPVADASTFKPFLIKSSRMVS